MKKSELLLKKEGAEKIRGTVTKFPDPDVTCRVYVGKNFANPLYLKAFQAILCRHVGTFAILI